MPKGQLRAGSKTGASGTLSDHRVITFATSTATQPRLPILDIQPRYKAKLRNYKKFESNLKLNLRDLPVSINIKAEIEQYSLLLENAIINTAKTTLALAKLRAKTVPWWRPHLTNLRNKTIKARRSFQRCHGSNRDQKGQMYLDQKTEYVRTLRRTKRDSWRKFVQEQPKRNPWRIIYKLCSSKITPRQAAIAVKTNNQQSSTWEKSVNLLLDALVIDDNPDDDTAEHRQLRTQIAEIRNENHDPPFTEKEITEAQSTFRTGKASGLDLIDINIIRGSWATLCDPYQKLANACLSCGHFPTRWKHGRIHAILKRKDTDGTDPGSYRPICLLPVMVKILEKLILSGLLPHTDRMFQRQYGF